MKTLYWDEANGKVTTDSDYAPIYDGGQFYIETWDIGDGQRISICYTDETKHTLNMYDFRERCCKDNGITLNHLRKLIRLAVPTDKYKETYEYYG